MFDLWIKNLASIDPALFSATKSFPPATDNNDGDAENILTKDECEQVVEENSDGPTSWSQRKLLLSFYRFKPKLVKPFNQNHVN